MKMIRKMPSNRKNYVYSPSQFHDDLTEDKVFWKVENYDITLNLKTAKIKAEEFTGFNESTGEYLSQPATMKDVMEALKPHTFLLLPDLSELHFG